MQHATRKSAALMGCLGLLAALGGNVHASLSAQDVQLRALQPLAKGEWTIRFRGSGESTRLCVRTGRELLQLRHQNQQCSRVTVENEASIATVQYTCRGNGYGRTTIRRETRELVQIDGQGFVQGRPFQFHAEARRTGNCK